MLRKMRWRFVGAAMVAFTAVVLVLLCCINRRGKRIIPRGKDELREGDTVIVVSTHKGMNDLQDIFRSEEMPK